MHKPYHIVYTTIYHPVAVMDAIHANADKFGHLGQLKVWIIGDKKTPPEVAGLSRQMTAKGLETKYLDIAAQDEWGKALEFYGQVPYHNDTRRNFGYLKALEEGCEILISIDDDNFPAEDDFIGGHKMTGQPWQQPVVHEPHNYHNVCEYLQFEPDRKIFPRGFPFNLRGRENQNLSKPALSGAVIGVTSGLWLEDPDIDATTWLQGKVSGVRYLGPDLLVLNQDTWSPVNTQNTSVTRKLVPAFLNVPMGWDVPGGKIQRYGDIWGGYFLQALMRGTKYHVAFGRPIVAHRRNPHVYIDDLRYEFWGMVLTDWLLDFLQRDFKPKSLNVINRVEELGEFINSLSHSQMPSWSPVEMKEFMVYTAKNLKLWAAACRKIGV